MRMPPHFWEYVLLGLKIVGVVGAFVGFSAEKHAERAKGRAGRIAAYVFLFVAIGAEMCDSSLKIKDAEERAREAETQSERFERLSHPMGVIGVTTSYKIDVRGSEFDRFRQHIGPWNDAIDVDRKRYPEVFELLKNEVAIYVSFYKKGNTTGEADTSFDYLLPRDAPRQTGKGFSYYTYVSGAYIAEDEEVVNDPDNRHSDGEIISTKDLLGSTVKVSFCPYVREAAQQDEPRLAELIRFTAIEFDFPGHQKLKLHTFRQSDVTYEPPSGHTDCSTLQYKFPDTAEGFKQAMSR